MLLCDASIGSLTALALVDFAASSFANFR